MSRRRPVANRDRNHAAIVAALRQIGCSVVDLAAVGDGVPDLLVGLFGVNVLVELKDGSRVPSERKLRATQIAFRDSWRGQWAMAESPGQAVEVVQAAVRGVTRAGQA